MGSIKEFWSVARRRPLTAVLLASTTAALSVGSVLAGGTLRDYLCPSNFSNLSGDYAGTIADGGAFHICFVSFGPKVLGEMTFDGSSVHVDYWGDVDTDDNRLILHYARKSNSVNPDHGNAFLSQVGKHGLQGYYESHVNAENHQTLDLERTNHTCNLNYFEDGW